MAVDEERVQAVFLAAVGAADAASQAALLDRECGTDVELRRHVEALLQPRQVPATIPDRPTATPFDSAPSDGTQALDSAAEAAEVVGKTLSDEAAEEAGSGATECPVSEVIPPSDLSATFPDNDGDEGGPGGPSVRMPVRPAESDPTDQLDAPQERRDGTRGAEPSHAGRLQSSADANQTRHDDRGNGGAPPGPDSKLAPGAAGGSWLQSPTVGDPASHPPGPGGTGGPGQTGRPLPAADPNGTGCYDQHDFYAPTVPAELVPARAPPPRRVLIPGYEILEELGRGGMGVVYKARDLRLQRLVALKMILAAAHAGPTGLARFKAEAEAVAQLQHPHIVQIYETGEHDGRPYFSLEFVEGGCLEQRMREFPAPPRAAAELVETLARTMDVAHQRGIVHRDLKPGNILLAVVSGQSSLVGKVHLATASSLPPDHWFRTTVPKIADFGLVKRVNDDSGQTQTGTVIGTPSYMAPEQAEGKNREIGPTADVYALGAILYDLLTGRPPFKAGRPIDTIRQVIEQEPVPPRQLEPRVPHDLETICLKCLQKEPARRYGSAAALADDLRRFLDDEPIQARPTRAWERAWKWGKHRPAVVALLGVSALAVVAVVLFVVWHNVSLRGQLDGARAEERLARRREQEALEGERLARVQGEAQKLLADARLAVAARDWTKARLHLTKALATVGTEPGLDNLKSSARDLLEQVEHELAVEADRQASGARFRKLVDLYDQAQFLGTLYTGMDLAANVKASRAAVRQALAVYGVSADEGARPTLDAYLSEAQKAEVLGDCYQLLLILAETEAQSASDGKGPEREQHLRKALGILERALQFGPPSRAYHLRRVRYLRLLGDEAGAGREEKAAAGASVLHVLDHFLMADELYRRGDLEQALKEFDQVLEQQPGHFWAQYLSALSLLRLRRPAEARAQLSACLAQRPDYVWLYLLRGFAQGELKAFGEADADFRKALDMPLEEYARYVLFVNRGVLRIREERFDDAVADLKTAIDLKPKEYQAYVDLAQAYRRQKKLDLALEEVQHAVQLEPGLAQVYRLRAHLYLEREEPALALKDFDQAVQRESADSPLLADDHVERGRLLLLDGKHAEALAAFEAALRRRKDHPLAQRLRAEALFQLGRYQEVIEAFDHYLETGKPLESVYRGRGLALAELGKYPGAIEDYTKALELHPTSEVLTYRGWAHLVCDAPKLALRDFELALQLDPDNAGAYNGRGFVRASQGRQREAARDATEALRHGPPSPRLLYNAARVYAQCGEADERRALESLRQALRLLPAEQRPVFWSTYVRTDPALQALRRYPEFVQLDAQMSRRK